MKSINPATAQIIKEYKEDTQEVVTSKLNALQEAFNLWKKTPLTKRIDVIRNAAEILEENKAEYAFIMTEEMGKVKTQAIQEVEKCARACNYYAENAEKFLTPQHIKTEARSSYVSYEPLGVILGIMPWNFPFWQVFRFAVPTLLAGNVAMLKHASNVPGCALVLEAIFSEAAEDLNLEVFKTALISSEKINPIISNPLVQAVSLTGSVAAGRNVASLAGSLIKKTVLELGGSDPYIILADANLELAAAECTKGRLGNCGQSCIAAKRLIVVQEVYDKFLKLLTANFKKMHIGDPTKQETEIGPLCSQQIFDTIVSQVQKSIEMGATCHYGGDRISEPGYFFQPTILTNIPADSPAATEEMFGPVACVFNVSNEQQALELANATNFGLGAAVFTNNLNHGADLATNYMHAGNVCVNGRVISDPRLPFGGIKQSGYGRELSEFGIHEFVNIKTIVIN